jgi:fluoroquinolone transport system ATP-binding protein
MVDVEHLFHDYEGKGMYAVEDVTFHIDKGEIFGFLGPSGAGKSTVQNLMTALLPLQQGQIRYDGSEISALGNRFFNRVGYSFEHPNLYSKLTGYENLKYYAGLYSGQTDDPGQLLERVGLKSAAHKRAGRYSKGMKQRLVFCRAVINRPQLLFLDEPTSGLDPATAAVIKEMIREQQQRGCTILLTTHDMHLADELSDRVAFLNEGKIVAQDTPRKLKLRYGEQSVRVEFSGPGGVESAVLFPENESDRKRLHQLIDGGKLETMHSQEATLEQIFIQLTGRGLE